MDEDSRICAVCGRVLEQHRVGTAPVMYRHAMVDEPADHPPVAVRTGDMPEQVRYRCDICLDEPVTHTLVTDREIGLEVANVLWDTEWAMCQECTELVLADDWLNLRRRAFAKFADKHGVMSEELKHHMRVAYRDLRGALVMIYKED